MLTIGIDEVGRGCWAGPLVAGAVLLPVDFAMPIDTWHLQDSKVLSKTQRLVADEHIRKIAIGYGLGWVSPQEIDDIGLTEAVRLAMSRAVTEITHAYDQIIIDGNYNFLSDNPKSVAIIKADGSVPSVSAASIIAKVARDTWMIEHAAVEYPNYGFDKHVGYGTAVHKTALDTHGLTPLHRRSFKPIRAFSAL